MNSRFFIACVAGVGSGFLLPLPALSPPAQKSAAAASHSATKSAEPPVAWPREPEEAAALPADQCIAALDAMLREFGFIAPAPEHQRVAVALLIRILRSSPVETNAFLKSRRLPAWLLASAWLERPDDVPDDLRRELPFMPAGLDAARRIAQTCAATDDLKANAFTDTMPASWRPALREAVLLGVATREPMRAMREAGISENLHSRIAAAAARSGPVEEAVRAIAAYIDDDFHSTIQPMIRQLHARDAAKTAELIIATENPKLRKYLEQVIAEESVRDTTPTSFTTVLAAPESAAPGEFPRAVRELSFHTLHDPDAAKAIWAAMPEGNAREYAAHELAATLAERDPAAAFEWADRNCPQNCFEIFRIVGNADTPAALAAALRLSQGNKLREEVLKAIHEEKDGPYGLSSIEDRPSLLRDLPADLQEIVRPAPDVHSGSVPPAPK